jgi:hypothetical protein
MTTHGRPAAAQRRAQTVRELHELIAALDRRLPQVERVGETAIARAAAALKVEALKRIQELEREALFSSTI